MNIRPIVLLAVAFCFMACAHSPHPDPVPIQATRRYGFYTLDRVTPDEIKGIVTHNSKFPEIPYEDFLTKLLVYPMPKYIPVAIIANITGRIIIQLFISSSGQVIRARQLSGPQQLGFPAITCIENRWILITKKEYTDAIKSTVFIAFNCSIANFPYKEQVPVY